MKSAVAINVIAWSATAIATVVGLLVTAAPVCLVAFIFPLLVTAEIN